MLSGLGEYISGVILYEETLFQDSPSGKPISELFKEQGIVLGIKVDKGVQPLYNTDGETVTQGITGLAERCKKYYARGARFAKWYLPYPQLAILFCSHARNYSKIMN